MKTNFIKFDGTKESIDSIQELVNKANIKYAGKHTYSLDKVINSDSISILSTNLLYTEDDEPIESSIVIPPGIGHYVFFNSYYDNTKITEYDFPSFGFCTEKYYLEYLRETSL